MNSPSDPLQFEISPAPDPVRWRSLPIAREIFRSALLLGGVLLVSLLVGGTAGWRWAAVAAGVQLVTLWRLFVPVDFELRSSGIHRQFLGRRTRIPWRSVARYEVCRQGVLILPESEGRAIDWFHGLYIPWEDRREEVLTALHFYLHESGQRSAGTYASTRSM